MHNDTQHKGLLSDTQYNYTKHNDTQHKGLISDTQHNDLNIMILSAYVTLGITTFSIRTPRIKALYVLLSITTFNIRKLRIKDPYVSLSISDTQHYALCRILFLIMLDVVMLSVVMLSVSMLSVEAPIRLPWILKTHQNRVKETKTHDKIAPQKRTCKCTISLVYLPHISLGWRTKLGTVKVTGANSCKCY